MVAAGTDQARLLSLALSSDRYASRIVQRVAPEDVGEGVREDLAAIADLLAEGAFVSPQTVAARTGTDVQRLVDLTERTLTGNEAGYFQSLADVDVLCDRVVATANRVRLRRVAAEIADGCEHGNDPSEIIDRAASRLATLDALDDADPPDDVDTWLARVPEREWIVEGIVARQDRMLLVAGEGGGKSTLLRQVAMMLSQGIHPWWLHPIPPIRVMLVDLENPPTIARRQVAALRDAALDHTAHVYEPPTLGTDEEERAPFAAYEPTRLRVEMRPEGIDVTHRVDERWLLRKVAAARPDLLIIGPVYKLHESEEEKSADVRQVLKVLDRIRTRFNCALWMETHAPHESFRKEGELRPAGSRLWLRWPEFVLTLAPRSPTADEWVVGHARPPREQRSFPRFLRRGDGWPWEVATL